VTDRAGVSGRPVLYVIACGSRSSADLAPFISDLQADGWEVCVVATPSALKFMDTAKLTELTGHVVRSDYKQPDEPDVLPPADAMVVAPATFNTICKCAFGSSDTLALGLLNEAVGLALPIVAVPTPNIALARHPAFVESVARLRSWGVIVIFDPDVYPLPTPNMGPPAAALFPWEALTAEVAGLRRSLSRR
jgi:phosphopantothenoylcysteine synthetase/decarboxylase